MRKCLWREPESCVLHGPFGRRVAQAVRDCLCRAWLAWLKAAVYVILARVFTIYYFAFFIVILPPLGIFEKTKPVPNSISEPVLGYGNRR